MSPLALSLSKGQTRRGAVKFASTLPPEIESGDAFPPSRHILRPAAPSPNAPRQTGGKALRLPVAPTTTSEDQVDAQQQQPRYRVTSRFSVPRTTALPKEEASQSTPNANKPPVRSFRTRPATLRTTSRPLIDPIDDSRYNSEPGQPLLQRSISNQNGKPVNQFARRKVPQPQKVNGGRPTTGPDTTEETSHPDKPTRRTFTRKPALGTTTPVPVRVTKRYYKKNGSKVETTSSSPIPSTTEAIRSFRVATRHQKPLKVKTTKKFDDGDEGDNYPEHFKLLLKNKPGDETKAHKAQLSAPTKMVRINPRVDTDQPTQSERVVHSALRSKPKPRVLLKSVTPKIATTTTTTTTTSAPATEYPQEEEGQLNFIEDELYSSGSLENTRPIFREGRTQHENRNQVPSKNSFAISNLRLN